MPRLLRIEIERRPSVIMQGIRCWPKAGVIAADQGVKRIFLPEQISKLAPGRVDPTPNVSIDLFNAGARMLLMIPSKGVTISATMENSSASNLPATCLRK